MDDDTALVARSITGDLTAFELLVIRYQRAVYNLAYRMLGNAADAEDAAQETFMRAFAGLSGYQANRKFGTWLLSITSHWCIDRLRRKKMVSLDFLQDFTVIGGVTEGPEATVMARENEREVQRWLGQLPESYRLITILRYWHDLSYNEIAEVTSLPLSTVRMRLFRARRLLAAAYGRVAQITPAPVTALAS